MMIPKREIPKAVYAAIGVPTLGSWRRMNATSWRKRKRRLQVHRRQWRIVIIRLALVVSLHGCGGSCVYLFKMTTSVHGSFVISKSSNCVAWDRKRKWGLREYSRVPEGKGNICTKNDKWSFLGGTVSNQSKELDALVVKCSSSELAKQKNLEPWNVSQNTECFQVKSLP